MYQIVTALLDDASADLHATLADLLGRGAAVPTHCAGVALGQLSATYPADLVLLEARTTAEGCAALRRLATSGSLAPVLVLTGPQEHVDDDALLAAGASDTLALAGLDGRVLWHAVRSVLRAAAQVQQRERRLREVLSLSSESHWQMTLDPPLPIDLPVEQQIDYIWASARLSDCNDVAARLYGFARPDEVIGLSLAQATQRVGGPSDQLLCQFVADGYQHELLRQLTSLSGEVRYIRVVWRGHLVDGHLLHIAGAQVDVTAEHHGRTLAAQLSAIVTSSDDAIVSSALDGTILTWNAGAERLFGYSAAEAVGQHYERLVLPEHHARLKAQFADVLASGKPLRFEQQIARGAGPLDMLIVVSPMRAADGQIVGMATVAHDLTAIKLASARITEGERRFRTVLENSRDAIFEINLATRHYDYVSPSVAEILGFDVESFRAGGAELTRAHIHSDDLAMVDASFAELIQGDSGTALPYEIEYRFETPHRGWRWLHSTRQLVRGADGVPHSVVGSIRDITESRRLLEAARESEQRFRYVVEATQEGVFMVDLSGTITYVNERLARMLGYETDALIGRPLISLAAITETRALDEYLARWTKAHHEQYEILLRHQTGATLSCYASSASIFNERGAVVGSFGMLLDVTDRLRAEAQLRDTERRFGTAIDNSRDVIYQYNLVTQRYEYGSPSVQELLGYALDEFQDAGLRLLYANVHPDDLGWFRAYNNRLVTQAPTEQVGTPIEYRFRTKHRGWRWISESRRIICDANGRAELVIGNIRDVTENRETEAALRLSEDRLGQAQRLAHLGYWEVELQTGAVYWSDELYRIYGLDPQHDCVDATTSMCYIHPDDQPLVSAAMDQALASQTISDVDHRIIRSGGEVRYLNSQTRCVVDDARQPIRLAGIVLDVTERKRVEQALRKSEYRLVQAQRIAQLGSWTFTFATQEYEWSAEMTHILGFTQEQMTWPRSAIEAVVHPDDHTLLYGTIAEMYRTGQPWDVDLRIVRQDGAVRVLNVQGELSYDADGRPSSAVGTALDITERQRAEAELRSSQQALQRAHDELERRVEERTRQLELAKDEAERANAAKSEFLSRMSHELRTPMNSILGFAQLMEMDALTGRQLERIGYIMKAGQHLLRLINEVLDLARVESGRLDVAPEPVPVMRTVEAAIAMIRPLAEQRRQLLLGERIVGDDVCVQADQQRLSQVLINLLSNASKYNRDGGSIRIRCMARPGNRLRLEVTDTGAGIGPAELPRLFVPFERLGAATSEIEGTGLGLALSKRLIELMGGAIGVESTVGVGSTFWIELPLTAAPIAAASVPLEKRSDLAVADAERTVLYIEDNLANLEVVAHVLAGSPAIRLLSAMQGQVGLDLAREHRPDLILLDVQLPDISGEEVLRRLTQAAPTAQIPVVVVSADATPLQIRKLLAAGAREYLTKPLDIRRFLDVVRAQLQPDGLPEGG